MLIVDEDTAVVLEASHTIKVRDKEVVFRQESYEATITCDTEDEAQIMFKAIIEAYSAGKKIFDVNGRE